MRRRWWKVFSCAAVLFALNCGFRNILVEYLYQHGPALKRQSLQLSHRFATPHSLDHLPAHTRSLQLKLSLDFRPASRSPVTKSAGSNAEIEQEYPNLFQTADGNAGLRLEWHRGDLSLVYSAAGGTLIGGVIAHGLKSEEWHHLDLVVCNENHVQAQITGFAPFAGPAPPELAINRVLIGQGFSDLRKFHGELRNVSLELRQPLPRPWGDWLHLGVSLLLMGTGAWAWRGMRRESRAVETGGLRIAPRFLLRSLRTENPEPETLRKYWPEPADRPLDPLLTLRSVACLTVVLGHEFLCVFCPSDLPERLRAGSWLRLLIPSPWAGVWLFFILSGYLMGKGFYSGRYQLTSESVLTFLGNRLVRIVPLYWCVVLLVYPLFDPAVFHPRNLWALITLLTFGDQASLPHKTIGALWSVSTEMQFYLLVPLFFFGLQRLVGQNARRAGLAVMGLAVGGWGLRVALLQGLRPASARLIYQPLISNLDLFLIGMLLNPISQAVRSEGSRLAPYLTRNLGLLLLGGVSVGMSVLSSSYAFAPLHQFFTFGPTLVIGPVAAIILCFEAPAVADRASKFTERIYRVGERIGLLTYSVYLCHEPILIAVRMLAPAVLTWPLALGWVALSLSLVGLVSSALYYTIEVPAEKRWKQQSAPVLLAEAPFRRAA